MLYLLLALAGPAEDLHATLATLARAKRLDIPEQTARRQGGRVRTARSRRWSRRRT